MKLKKLSRAIKKSRKAPKIQANSPKDSQQSKRLIVSIPIVKELNNDLQPQKNLSLQNTISDTTNCTPNHKEVAQKFEIVTSAFQQKSDQFNGCPL